MPDRRKPEYLSPSALSTYESNPTEYYLRYISPYRPPKMLQTQPMSVGSAFDAYVKSYLHEKIYGKNHPEAAKYELGALLKAQVEPHNLEWATLAGKYVFDCYKGSGALADLMLELNKASDSPRFEFEVKGVIEGANNQLSREGVSAKKMGVPLLGKPDIRFINSEGAHAIFDWKVNGFCGRGNTSPQAGYVQLLEEYFDSTPEKPQWKRCGQHKDAIVQFWRGMEVNMGSYFNVYDPQWASQLATYSWLLGETVGTESIVGVDQICCNGAKKRAGDRPSIRIAKHRSRISQKFQFDLMARYQNLWSLLTEEPFYFFRDRSFEDSAQMCDLLDQQAQAMADPDNTSDESWVFAIGRE